MDTNIVNRFASPGFSPYRRESSRFCSEDDKSPTLSHTTAELWQKPAA